MFSCNKSTKRSDIKVGTFEYVSEGGLILDVVVPTLIVDILRLGTGNFISQGPTLFRVGTK